MHTDSYGYEKVFVALMLGCCLFALAFVLQNCGTPRRSSRGRSLVAQEQTREMEKQRLRRTYRASLEVAASSMNRYLQKEISPQSGKDLKHKLYLENIEYDETENLVVADVLLTWQAREFWAGVPYGECQLYGTLYLYMPVRGVDQTRVSFQMIRHNDHLTKVAKKKHMNMLREGVTINLR